MAESVALTDNEELLATAAEGLPVIGKLLAKIIRQRRLGILIGVGAAFALLVVYPLLLPFLTASLVNTGMLSSLQEPYARQVRKAFQADEFASEMTSRSNKLLDYFQVIEFIGAVNETRDYPLSAAPNQFIKIRAERATLFTNDPEKCALPEHLGRVMPAGAMRTGPKIFTLTIAGEAVGDININPRSEPVVLTSAQWQAISRKSDPGRIDLKLVPIPALENVPCEEAKADVRLTFEVFKNLVTDIKEAK